MTRYFMPLTWAHNEGCVRAARCFGRSTRSIVVEWVGSQQPPYDSDEECEWVILYLYCDGAHLPVGPG